MEATDNYINIINNNNKTFIYDSIGTIGTTTNKQNNYQHNNKLNIENLYLNSEIFRSPEPTNKIEDLFLKKAFYNQDCSSNKDVNNFSNFNMNVNTNNSIINTNNIKSTVTSDTNLFSTRNVNNIKKTSNNHLDYLKSLKQKNADTSSNNVNNIVNSVNRVSKTKNLNSDLVFQINYNDILEKQKFKDFNNKQINHMEEKEITMKGVNADFKQKVLKAEQKITNKLFSQRLLTQTEFNLTPSKLRNSNKKLNEMRNTNLLTSGISNPKQEDGLTIKGNELLQKLNSKIKGFS